MVSGLAGLVGLSAWALVAVEDKVGHDFASQKKRIQPVLETTRKQETALQPNAQVTFTYNFCTLQT